MTQKELEQKVIDAEGRVAKREAVLKLLRGSATETCYIQSIGGNFA